MLAGKPFNDGDLLICIDAESYTAKFTTNNKIYEVNSYRRGSSDFVTVYSDCGNMVNIFCNRFRLATKAEILFYRESL